MTPDRLEALLGCLPRVGSLVLGDAMVDEYIWGVAERISPEAPVMVLRRERVTQVPGGAANVVHGLRTLGARSGLVAVVGEDAAAGALRERLVELGCDPTVLLPDADRPTTVKTRVVAQTQQVVRIDTETRAPLSTAVAERVIAATDEALAGFDGLLLSDYDKGVLTPTVIAAVLRAAERRGVRVAVNAKPHHAARYRGADLVSVNRVEAEAITGVRPGDPVQAREAAQRLAEIAGCRHVLITLGGDGALLRCPDGECHHAHAVAVPVYDVAGAGDTTICTTHLALCAGASPAEAVELAMLAAAVVVRKVGVAAVDADEIRALAAGHF